MWSWVVLKKKSGAFLEPNAGTWGTLVLVCALASFFTAIVGSHHNAVCVTFVKFHMRSWGIHGGKAVLMVVYFRAKTLEELVL